MNFNWNCSKAEEINFVYRDSHFFIKIFLISIYIENNSFIESFQSLEESGTLNKNEKKKIGICDKSKYKDVLFNTCIHLINI